MLRSLIERHRIPAFLLVAFGWTWIWDAVYYAFGWWNSLPIYINCSGAWWLVATVLVGLYGRSMTPGESIESLS